MAVETTREPDPLISFNEAAKLLPRNVRPSYSTWWRWHRKGIRGVRLCTTVIGGRRFTSATAVEEFLAQVTAAADGVASKGESSRRRELAVRQAEDEIFA